MAQSNPAATLPMKKIVLSVFDQEIGLPSKEGPPHLFRIADSDTLPSSSFFTRKRKDLNLFIVSLQT
jgi:hypothetical protein